jgi:hypothetical protein
MSNEDLQKLLVRTDGGVIRLLSGKPNLARGEGTHDSFAYLFCEGRHWRFLGLVGRERTAYYWNPYGEALPRVHFIRVALACHPSWTLQCLPDELQSDGFQCGVWSYVALRLFIECAIHPNLVRHWNSQPSQPSQPFPASPEAQTAMPGTSRRALLSSVRASRAAAWSCDRSTRCSSGDAPLSRLLKLRTRPTFVTYGTTCATL